MLTEVGDIGHDTLTSVLCPAAEMIWARKARVERDAVSLGYVFGILSSMSQAVGDRKSFTVPQREEGLLRAQTEVPFKRAVNAGRRIIARRYVRALLLM